MTSCTDRPEACHTSCPGWFVNQETALIERCDECARFAFDEHAACHAHTCSQCRGALQASEPVLLTDLDAWHATALAANQLPGPHKLHPPYALSAYTDHTDLAQWLVNVDPNGTFTDAQREALDEEPLSLDELWENVGHIIAAAQ